MPQASSGALPTGFGGFGQQQPSVVAVVPAGPQITLDSRFTELPEVYKKIIEQTNAEYKKPMREGLDEIARYQPKIMDELRIELRRTNLAALKLGNQQDLLLKEIKIFHNEAKQNLKDVRKYGANGLQQIQNRGGLGARSYVMNEELPVEFYVDAADKIESRLVNVIDEIHDISRQLLATLGAVGEEGQYGQQTRIGPQHLVKLIQRQSEAFARVAACVAKIHNQADSMRDSYLRTYCHDENQRYSGSGSHSHSNLDPFAAADRAEAANERIMSKKLKQEEFNRPNLTATTTTTARSSSTPSTSLSVPPAAGFGGFGSLGAPSPGTQGGFGSSGGGFGTPSAAGVGGFGGLGSTSTFGQIASAPAAGGFGGTGFKALDLATGFGAAPASFGSSFGGGTSTSSRKSGKSRK